MRREQACMVAVNAVVIAVALLIARVFIGTEGAELGVLAGIPMMFAVSLSEFVLYKKAEYSKERDAVLFALQQIYSDIKYNGKSLLSSMNDSLIAMDRSVCARVYDLLLRVQKKLLLGAQLDEAVSSTCTGTSPACVAWGNVGKEYANGREPALAIKNAYDRLYNTIKLEDAENAGKLQKYLTVSMALGTVLPSFAMFAFTGYSMVYYSPMLFSLFGVAMLVLMPNIFALVRAHTAGLYEV
jgi:hypothetical protein